MSRFSLDNKVAIVTGGSKGIGRAIALTFAEQGADLCIVARGREALDATCGELKQFGRRALGIGADVLNDADLERVAQMAVDQLGGVDILVNNAIFSSPESMGPAAKITRDFYMKTIRGNLWAPLRLSQLCRVAMMERGGGVILNISSNAGLIGDPGLGAYAHSKAALINMTQQLAKEWADEAGYVVDDCDARVLVTSPALTEVATALMKGTPKVELPLMVDSAAEGFEPYEAAVAAHSAEREGKEPLGDFLLYSSGTTGRPKGIRFPLSERRVSDGQST